LAADVRLRLLDGHLVPWAAARWNFLLGQIDEGHAGVRVTLGSHALTLEGLYRFPSFDGDSIFNVFAVQPYLVACATWVVWPSGGARGGYLRGVVRRLENDDAGHIPERDVDTSAIAAGAGVGAAWIGAQGSLRLDLFHEDGYGGLRSGGVVGGRWQLASHISVDGRASLVRIEEDSIASLRATTLAVQAGGVWRLGRRIAVRLAAREDSHEHHPHHLLV